MTAGVVGHWKTRLDRREPVQQRLVVNTYWQGLKHTNVLEPVTAHEWS